MKKLKLYGFIKGEKHSVFYIEKNEIFLEHFRAFLHKLGFKRQDTAKELLSLLGDSDNNYSNKKYSNKLYQDKYFYFENKDYKIDLFFGKNKVIVSIFNSTKNQNKINKLINQFVEFHHKK
jgi:hypothetical protein